MAEPPSIHEGDSDVRFDLLREVLGEHPELFWANRGRSNIYDDSGPLTLSPTHLLAASEIPSMRDAHEARAAQSLAWTTNLSSDADKAKALHDWLIEHAEYGKTEVSGGQVPMVEHTAYGIMVNGTGVCDGYAHAYQDLLSSDGVTAAVIESRPTNHVWNPVSIAGTRYHADVTYDDPVIMGPTGAIVAGNHVTSAYFLKSDGYMQANDHYGWTNSLQAPDTSLDAKSDWQV